MRAQFSLLNRSIMNGFDKMSSTLLAALIKPTSVPAHSHGQSHIPNQTGVPVRGRTRRKITSGPRRRPLHAMHLAVSTAFVQSQYGP
jgi:hypothetical protein